MPYADPSRQRAYQAAWMSARRQRWMDENGPCVDCSGYEDLEVDHMDAGTKITHRVWSWSLARRQAELEKCVVRCRSCHDKKTAASGEHTSKIGVEAVREMRQLRANGASLKELAEKFGIAYGNVSKICRKKIWSQIE